MKSPKISVFLSYYNDAYFLKSAIDSVLNQDFQDFELILLNHATTDNCREIAHSYDDKRIIHIDKNFNYGAGCGLLIKDMLDVAHGKYIKFYCADDILHHDCLSKLVNFMEKNPDCDCVCSNMDFINVSGKKINHKIYDFKENFDNNRLLKTLSSGDNYIYFPTVMMRRDVLNNIFIDSSFIMFLDVSLWTELLCHGYNIKMLDEKLISYRIHSGQISRNFESCSFVEKIALANIFYKINDTEIVKNLCDDVEYSKDLTNKDKKYLSFIVALHNLKNKNLSSAISGYLYLHDFMNNEKLRIDVEKRFGFTVADFRKMYKDLQSMRNFLNIEFKKINFVKLLKLIGRKIFCVLTPKFYKNILKGV